jgi:hypothetical protein
LVDKGGVAGDLRGPPGRSVGDPCAAILPVRSRRCNEGGFVRGLPGRGDDAIIGDIVEPNTKVLELSCGESELLEWLAANTGVDAAAWKSVASRCRRPSRAAKWRCFW